MTEPEKNQYRIIEHGDSSFVVERLLMKDVWKGTSYFDTASNSIVHYPSFERAKAAICTFKAWEIEGNRYAVLVDKRNEVIAVYEEEEIFGDKT